ncbi:response regulator containing a CheY-like receiver domain and an HTH DNA-binding domain, partial [Rhizobium leguminosarum bv. trifolii WSM2012]
SMGKDSSSETTFSQRAEEGLRKHKSVIMAVLKAHWNALDAPHLTIPRATSLADSLREELRGNHGISISTRQAEVALLILQGHSSPSIGSQLGVSTETVKVFRKQLYRRCDISSQAELFGLFMPMLGKASVAK